MKSPMLLQQDSTRLVELWSWVAEETATRCCTSATRDIETVSLRVRQEGVSFLTITLANLGKAFESWLDQGFVSPSGDCRFGFLRGTPRFLGGFLDLVFSRDTGVLLDAPSIDAILSIRQLTLMFSKILLPCSDAREQRAFDAYVECEKDVLRDDAQRSPIDLEAFRRVSNLLFKEMFLDIDREIYEDYTLPKHGPGATADRRRANAKYQQSTWPARLEKEFPMELYLLPNARYYEHLAEVDILEPGDEIPVRVISVPKTLKTPRIIGIEPTAMQYAQQSILPMLLERIKADTNLNSFLGFDDQEPNQLLAKEGSLSGELATLDLSEASDRVSNQLVLEMTYSKAGPLRRSIQACRSERADVNGHGVIPLAKFASMGSALTFPIEAMVFLTIILIGIERELNTQITKEDFMTLRGKVRVYGDDIIIPVEYVRSVVSTLHAFGAKVNESKSFWTGRFRESCGKEYYAGHDVSIVKVRRTLPTRRKHVEEIISLVAFRNLMYQSGYWATCQRLDSKIRKILKYFPVVEESSPALGRLSFLPYEGDRMNGYLHRPEVKAWEVRAKIPKSNLEDHSALLKCLLQMERREEDRNEDVLSSLDHLMSASIDEQHLTRAGRPRAVDIKLGYVTPF